MKQSMALIAVAIAMHAILFSGCASHPTRNELSKVTFGNSLEQVRKTLKLSSPDFQPRFRVSTTNGVLEMVSVFCEEAGGKWHLLFQDGRFFSARAGQQHYKDWPGFSNLQDPDFNELAWFWKDFSPPIEPNALLPLHTNVVYASSGGQAENIVWGIYLFPIAVPLFALHLITNNEADLAPHLTIQPGMTEVQAANLLRSYPRQQIGNERRSVYWFSIFDISVGFDSGRVAFVVFGKNVCPPEPGINQKSSWD